MKIAIIGAGNVGGTLGTAWAMKAGHEVFFGVRSPNSDRTQALVRALGGKARAGTAADAAAFGEMIVLTTPWPTTEAAIRSMGDLNGRIILDATNPLATGPDGLGLEIGHSTSAGEKVQGWAKGASVFKTLNTTGFGNMANPVFRGLKSVMFVAGDDTMPGYWRRMPCCGSSLPSSAVLVATGPLPWSDVEEREYAGRSPVLPFAAASIRPLSGQSGRDSDVRGSPALTRNGLYEHATICGNGRGVRVKNAQPASKQNGTLVHSATSSSARK